MAKFLILGSQGLLGYELQQYFKANHQVKALTRKKVDITRPEQVEAVLDADDWTAVLDASGFLDPEACESEPDKARLLNAEAPANTAALAARRGIPYVYFSDVLIFDGEWLVPYTEADEAGPLSVYGQSKLAGEEGVRLAGENHLIIRSSWVFGHKMRGIFRKIGELYLEKEEMKVVDDFYGTPTWGRDIALALETLLETGIRGTFHVVNSGYCSWYDYTRLVLELLYQASELPRLKPMTGAELRLKSSRPRNSTLDGSRLSRETGLILPGWEAALEAYFMQEGLLGLFADS